MAPEMLRRLLDEIKSSGVKQVALGYYGEIMAFPGWKDVVNELVDARIPIRTCSNFARVLTEDDALAFSRMTHIQVSIDTPDIALNKKIRHAVDTRTIIYNVQRVRAAALMDGRRPPPIQFCCVLTDKVLPTLKELVAFSAACGAESLSVNDIQPFEGLSPDVRSIFDLTGDEFRTAVGQLGEAILLSQSIGLPLTHTFWGLLDSKVRTEEARASGNTAADPFSRHTVQAIQGVGHILVQDGVSTPKTGESTRHCLSPWTSAYVEADGRIMSCCFRGASMGTIADGKTLAEAMESAEYVELRRQLITANVTDNSCSNCHGKTLCHPQALGRDVASALARAMADGLAHSVCG
jgi:radical SAM protein with 4Fe4S-binding SPASM domain